jgi:HK97 family phage portal protein
MGFLEWMGFSKPRDAPEEDRPEENRTKENLPEVTDSVRDSGQIFSFGTASSGEKVDEQSAMQISTVYACVRLLAETVAALPLHLYRYTDGGKGKESAFDHPLYRILYRQPNDEMSSFIWRETMMTHLLLWGNAYSQIIRDGRNNVLGLYPLLPENVEVDRDEQGQLYYIYHAYTDEVPGEQNQDIYFRKDEILHIPGLGFNGLVGFSPIAMMKNSLGTTLAVEKYGASFFKNGAQPSGVLEHPGVLKDPQKIRDNWTAVYGGANNAHRVAVLEEGMAYKAISLPPEDSQFLSTRQFGVEEICRIFRVPPHMVQSLEHATFSNIEHQSIDFVVHTLTPWLVRFEQAIIKDLLLEEEQDVLFPKFNVDGLLRGDYQSRMNGYATGISNGFLSPNDIHRLENMDLIPAEEGGDDYYLNGGYVKLRDAGKFAQAKQAAVEQNQPKDEPEKPSEGTENAADSENGRSESTPQKPRERKRKR